jgi:hypothetical protein
MRLEIASPIKKADSSSVYLLFQQALATLHASTFWSGKLCQPDKAPKIVPASFV